MPQTLSPWLVWLVYAELLYVVWLAIGFLLFLVGAYSFALSDCLWQSLRANEYALLLLLPFIILFVVITFAYGCARLRFAIEPLLMLLAAHGWLWGDHDRSHDVQ